MQSSFTAFALAFAIVTMTALPAMAFTLIETPVDGEKLGAVPPNGALVGTSAIDELGAVPPNGALVGAVPPNGALPAPGADQLLLDRQMGVAPSTPQTLGVPQPLQGAQGTAGIMVPPRAAPTGVMVPPNGAAPAGIAAAAVLQQKVRTVPSAAAARNLQAAPAIQAIQGQ